MAEGDNQGHAEQQRVQRVETPAEQTTIGLEEQPLNNTPQAAQNSLVGDPRLSRSINAPVRIAVMQRMQQSYGNRALRRYLQRFASQPTAEAAPEVENGTTEQANEAADSTASHLSAPESVETSVQRTPATGEHTQLQRVPINVTGGNFDETLLTNTPTTAVPAGGTASYTAGHYTGNTAYQMERKGDNVEINVRVLFLDPPSAANTGGSELPSSDPRRAQVTPIMSTLTTHWNNKFRLFGHRLPDEGAGAGSHASAPPSTGSADAGSGASAGTSAPPASTEVRLPLVFKAEAVWTSSAAHDQQVFLHSNVADPNVADPSRTVGAPAGTAPQMNVIDAGNWYLRRAAGWYGSRRGNEADPDNFPMDAIYAHEYGHYLGIPDEYSRSNPAMHTIMHGVAQTQGERDQMDRELDQAGVRAIIMAALLPQIQSRLTNINAVVTAAITQQKSIMEHKLADSLRQNWRDSGVITNINNIIRPQLEAHAAAGTAPATPDQPHARAALPTAVTFEAAKNMSYVTIANHQTDLVINPTVIQGILGGALSAAMAGATNNGRATIGAGTAAGGAGGMTMIVETRGVPGANAALDTAAGSAADAMLGTASPVAAPRGRVPTNLGPSTGLLSTLAALPGTWRTMASLFQADQIQNDILTQVRTNFAGATFAGAVGDRAPRLYREIYNRFTTSSNNVAQVALQRFLSQQIQPLIRAQLDEVVTAINNELAGHTTATGTATSAASGAPPDPAVTARAAAIRSAMTTAVAQARAMQSTPESTTTPGVGGAPATTTQNQLHTRFTMAGMMGNNYEGQSVRTDHMANVTSNFNSAAAVPNVRKREETNDFVTQNVT